MNTTTALFAVRTSIKQLWNHVGLPESIFPELLLTGDPDMAAKSSFKVGHLAQTTTALAGLSASALYGLRTSENGDGHRPVVEVDARKALLNFASEQYTLMDDQPPTEVWDDLAGLYPTRDGHVRIHTNFPHHRKGILHLLDIANPTRAVVANALLEKDALTFEEEATKAGMCVAAVRTFDEWDRHPQAQTLRARLPIELVKIGDAPVRRFSGHNSNGVMPLDGVRVLELTRVLAGPIAGRSLARFGADVLWITSPNLPSIPVVDIDTSRGKRAAQLDLNSDHGVESLQHLVDGCDVFLQSYRPGSLARRGFDPASLAKRRPGIVVANLRGYGCDGPWAEKRAFDSLVQAATGFNAAEGAAWERHSQRSSHDQRPIRTLPVQCLDHAAGHLLAFGITAALCRTMQEGGSWEVRVSLAGVGEFLRNLGQLDDELAFKGRDIPKKMSPPDPEIMDMLTPYYIRERHSETDSPSSPKPIRERTLMALEPAASLALSSSHKSTARQVPGSLDCDLPTWL